MTSNDVAPLDCCLLLDLGNTRLKVGLWHRAHAQIVPLAAIPHADPVHLKHELKNTLHRLIEQGMHWPSLALGVSVASQSCMNHIEQVLLKTHNPLQTRWIWPQSKVKHIANAYPDPKQLGADRWMSIIGLHHHFGPVDQSLILANFGTATTVDTLSKDLVFMGGLILPGVSLMQEALRTGTARLPLADGQITHYPTDTHSAISSGIAAAQIGAVLRQYDLSHARDQRAPILCVSGGAWQTVAPEWERTRPEVCVTELPHVVLMGLSFFANHWPLN